MRRVLGISLIILVFCTWTVSSSLPTTSSNASQITAKFCQFIDCDLDGDALSQNLDTLRMTKTGSAFIIAIAPFSLSPEQP